MRDELTNTKLPQNIISIPLLFFLTGAIAESSGSIFSVQKEKLMKKLYKLLKCMSIMLIYSLIDAIMILVMSLTFNLIIKMIAML